MEEDNYYPRNNASPDKKTFYPFPLAIDTYAVARGLMKTTSMLEATFPEFRKNRKVEKNQNEIFYIFRDQFRELQMLTHEHLIDFCKDKITTEDTVMMDKGMKLIERPYGSYDLKEITSNARAWWNLLIKTKTFIFSPGYSTEPTQFSARKY